MKQHKMYLTVQNFLSKPLLLDGYRESPLLKYGQDLLNDVEDASGRGMFALAVRIALKPLVVSAQVALVQTGEEQVKEGACERILSVDALLPSQERSHDAGVDLAAIMEVPQWRFDDERKEAHLGKLFPN